MWANLGFGWSTRFHGCLPLTSHAPRHTSSHVLAAAKPSRGAASSIDVDRLEKVLQRRAQQGRTDPKPASSKSNSTASKAAAQQKQGAKSNGAGTVQPGGRASRQSAATLASKGAAGMRRQKQQDRSDEEDLELSQEESDRLFDQVAQQLKTSPAFDSDSDDDELTLEEEVAALETARSKAKTGSNSGTPGQNRAVFKGFGLLPSETAGTANSSSTSTAAGAGAASASSTRSASRSVPPLKIFLYAAESSKTQDALQAAGWQDKVVITPELKLAHAVVSAKLARGGKHNNLKQGEKTAQNFGLPFVCVGRHMTAQNLTATLGPVLSEHRAKHGVHDIITADDQEQQQQDGEEGSLSGAAAAAAAGGAGIKAVTQSKKAAVVRGQGWKEQMLADMGLIKT